MDITDEMLEMVTHGPIMDNWLMRAWAATNLAINPETVVSYGMHAGADNVARSGEITPDRGKYATLAQRQRCWISRSIRHNSAETLSNSMYQEGNGQMSTNHPAPAPAGQGNGQMDEIESYVEVTPESTRMDINIPFTPEQAIEVLMNVYRTTYAEAGTALITALIGRSARIGRIGIICDVKDDNVTYTLIEL